MLEIEVAVVKMGRHRAESGDTVEMIERPGGGFAFVLADGQGSGRGAKTLSNMVVTRAITMLKDGMPDEAVAQEVNSYLYNYRQGQVGVSLDMLSVDIAGKRLQVTRNSVCPFYVLDAQGLHAHSEPSAPVGLSAAAHPQLTEVAARPYTYVLLFTEGLLRAGSRFGDDLALDNYLAAWPAGEGRPPEALADDLLRRALELERGTPEVDLTVLALALLPRETPSKIRRLKASFPLDLA